MRDVTNEKRTRDRVMYTTLALLILLALGFVMYLRSEGYSHDDWLHRALSWNWYWMAPLRLTAYGAFLYYVPPALLRWGGREDNFTVLMWRFMLASPLLWLEWSALDPSAWGG